MKYWLTIFFFHGVLLAGSFIVKDYQTFIEVYDCRLEFMFESFVFRWNGTCAINDLAIDIGYILRASYDELRIDFPKLWWLLIPFQVLFSGWFLWVVLLGLVFFLRKSIFRLYTCISFYFSDLRFLIGSIFICLFLCLITYAALPKAILVSEPGPYQRFLARYWLVFTGINTAIFLVVNRRLIWNRIHTFLFQQTSPYSLAITRILFFSYCAYLYVVTILPGYDEGLFALERKALPLIGWLVHIIPINSSIYESIAVIGLISSIMVVVGFRTRLFLVTASISIFYVVAVPNFFGKLWHQQLIIWITWILASSPCFEVLSVDSIRKRDTNSGIGPFEFHLKVIWLHFGLIYFFAGFYKLWICGFDWALSESMINQVRIEWFEHFWEIPEVRFDNFPLALKLSGLAVVLFELAYILFLFKQKTRWISVLGGLVMHNAIGYIMYINFFVMLQSLYLVFIPWNRLIYISGIISNRNKDNSRRIRLGLFSIGVPVIVFVSNLLCGVFNINSYPFSIYPVYAEIVPNTVKFFDYRVSKDGNETSMRHLGVQYGFNWENHSRTEYYLIRELEATGNLDTAGVLRLWDIWTMYIPDFKDLDTVKVYVVESSLDPAFSDSILSDYHLLDVIRENTSKP